MSITLLYDTLLDAVKDCVSMLPFLFIAFLILEAMEHYSNNVVSRAFQHKKGGPALGALLGCFPQCGFSALASSLFCGGAISIGTLLAVYLSTSDEAILILLANPGQASVIWKLLAAKIFIAVVAGYLIDFIWNKGKHKEKHVEELCEHCGCHDHHGIVRPALNHTFKLFFFLFIFTFVLNMIIELIGLETLSALLLQNSIFQPLLAALLGMIPNCAASVLVTQLFLDGIISFGSAVAGLCTGAGVGLIILFRTNKDTIENFKIIGILYGVAAVAGILLQLI